MGDASHVRVWMLVFFFFLPPFSPLSYAPSMFKILPCLIWF